MDRPGRNRAGYEARDLTRFASGLRGKLLLIHGLMDENVHFESTARLIDALIAADKYFDLLVLPGERHSIASPTARAYVTRRTVDYLAEHL